MNKFHYLAGAYLNKCKIENNAYNPHCILCNKYPKNYEKPNEMNLFVLDYDRSLGEEILQTNDVEGFYKHFALDKTTREL